MTKTDHENNLAALGAFLGREIVDNDSETPEQTRESKDTD